MFINNVKGLLMETTVDIVLVEHQTSVDFCIHYWSLHCFSCVLHTTCKSYNWVLIQSVATYTLSITFVENNGLFMFYSITDRRFTFIFTFAGGWGKDLFYLIAGTFGLLFCVVTEKPLNKPINNLLFQSETFLWCRVLIEIKVYRFFLLLLSLCLTYGHRFRFNLKNQ